MKFKSYTRYIAIATVTLGLLSCEKDETSLDSSTTESSQQNAKYKDFKSFSNKSANPEIENDIIQDFQIGKPEFDAVESSDCMSSALSAVTTYEYNILVNSILKYWDRSSYTPIDLVYEDYFTINNYAAQLGINAGYFGENGEYTNYVSQEKNSLEKFWSMPNLIRVNGQHSATLADLEVIEFMYQNFTDLGLIADDPIENEKGEIVQEGATLEELLQIAAYFNTNSDQIPENPVYASDAFATQNGTIVLGDGIIELLVKTGLEDKIVISSILSHEWSHQIQFANVSNWEYPIDAFARTAESTRMTELEADFFTGFYLTHKRGGTFNWKRVEEALINFYYIGDCSIESTGHHGTPLQRLESAKAGYEFAKSLQKNGFLPDPSVVHNEFLNNFEDLL